MMVMHYPPFLSVSYASPPSCHCDDSNAFPFLHHSDASPPTLIFGDVMHPLRPCCIDDGDALPTRCCRRYASPLPSRCAYDGDALPPTLVADAMHPLCPPVASMMVMHYHLPSLLPTIGSRRYASPLPSHCADDGDALPPTLVADAMHPLCPPVAPMVMHYHPPLLPTL